MRVYAQIDHARIELFILKCATLKISIGTTLQQRPAPRSLIEEDQIVKSFVAQFAAETRENASRMAEHYKLFYMLENEIRKLIDDTLSEEHKGPDWWETYAPESAKAEYRSNLQREQDAGFTFRSDDPLDYITFGQLGEIIRSNYKFFGGILSSPKAMGRVLFALNNLRGPIAHCGLLAEDEIDRLRTSVKDWFRLLEGPK